MQPNISDIVGADLQKANWQRAAAHLSSLINRGWASLWPSKLSCPTAAALHQMMNADLLKRLRTKEIKFSEAVDEQLARDPLSDDTLLLFEMGHVWERIIAGALLRECGASLSERDNDLVNVGRSIRIESKEQMIAGEIDLLLPGPSGSLAMYEIKSTKLYGMQNYPPSESHIIQLYVYTHLWNLQNKPKVTEAFLVYTPNDKHPKATLGKMKVVSLSDARRERGLKVADIQKRLELAQQYIQEATLDDPPPPFKTGEAYPCSMKGGSVPLCVFYNTCFPDGSDPEVWDIPF